MRARGGRGRGENDEYMRIAGRETGRDPCLGVICEHSDDETAKFVSVPRRQELSLARLHIHRNPSPDTFLLPREDVKALRNHEYFSVSPPWPSVCLSDRGIQLAVHLQ